MPALLMSTARRSLARANAEVAGRTRVPEEAWRRDGRCVWPRQSRRRRAVDKVPAVMEDYIEGLKAHDVERIASNVSDDLAFVTPTTVLGKEQFLQMLRALYAGF